MRINKYWTLTKWLTPIGLTYACHQATQEQFDSVTIWYDGIYKPIVMSDRRVNSSGAWMPRNFYRGILMCLATLDDTGYRSHRYNIRYIRRGSVKWGCRVFTRKRLLEIKGAMEYHYGDRLKGVEI